MTSLSKFSILSLAATLLTINGASAFEVSTESVESLRQHEDYYKIDTVEVEAREVEPNDFDSFVAPGMELPASEDTVVVVDKIINLGQKIWTIVEKNKPVVNWDTLTANALPSGLSTWSDLNGWMTPKAYVYSVSYKNVFRMTVVRFNFRVAYTPGGSYQGTGRYLTNIHVRPQELYVAWGYKFNAKAMVPSVTNAGTQASPIGGAEVLVEWTIDTVMSHVRGSAGAYVRGDGKFVDLTNGSSLR